MVAFPRSSKTLIFVRGARTKDVDDTVTEVLRPGPRGRFSRPKIRAHRPPKPRTTREIELPSIMVTQDSWAPTASKSPPPLDQTVIGARPPRPRAEPSPRAVLVSARRYNLTLAIMAVGLGLLCLYLAPVLSRAMETAFTALNR